MAPAENCVKYAEGQRCMSDFWCPEGLQCSKKSRQCTTALLPPQDRFPAAPRLKPCSITLDCDYILWCLNGVCLPRALGWSCGPTRLAVHVLRCIEGVQVLGTEGMLRNDEFECYLGMGCRSGRCAVFQLGDKCDSDAGCPPLSRCDIDSRICIRPGRGEVCESSAQCQGELRCVPFKYGRGLCATSKSFSFSMCVVRDFK